MNAITLEAFAKLNLGLRVRGVRPDGFHEIESVFQTISLSDRLTIQKRDDPDIRVSIRPDSGINPRDNLVTRAATYLQRRWKVSTGAEIRLEKRIPIGAGLGGGSSDAAATLTGLNEAWDLNLGRADLHALALELGSDVPFFLRGGRCRVRGRGEWIESVHSHRPSGEAMFVLLMPPWSLSTAQVYRTFDQLNASALLRAPYPNDLEAAALRLEPQLGDYRDWLESHELAFGLSGSGPVYFIVARTVEEADHWADRARRNLPGDVVVCRPTADGHRRA